jgi:hypothetical protein
MTTLATTTTTRRAADQRGGRAPRSRPRRRLPAPSSAQYAGGSSLACRTQQLNRKGCRWRQQAANDNVNDNDNNDPWRGEQAGRSSPAIAAKASTAGPLLCSIRRRIESRVSDYAASVSLLPLAMAFESVRDLLGTELAVAAIERAMVRHRIAVADLKRDTLSLAEATEICDALSIKTYKLTFQGIEGWRGGEQRRMKGGSYVGGTAAVRSSSNSGGQAKDDGEVCSLVRWWSR